MLNETSKYIQINDYCLIEYIYNGGISLSQSDKRTYVINNKLTNELGFIAGPDPDASIMSNKTKEELAKTDIANFNHSAIPVNAQKSLWSWAGTSSSGSSIWNYPVDTAEEFSSIHGSLSYKNNEGESDVPTSLKPIYYDKVRIHILAGYYLDGIEGIVFEPVFKEKSQLNMPASSYFYSRSLHVGKDDPLVFAKTPLILSQKSYDKYIEFYVPSLSNIQYEYEKQSKSKTSDFAYYYSHTANGGVVPAGYMHDSPIYINLYELSDVFYKNGCTFYYVKNRYTASIKATDNSAKLGCTIYESRDGDYFEYYPTWDGELINEYMQALNDSTYSNGETWSIYNTLEVQEIVGLTPVKTYSSTSVMMSSDYSAPLIFRPVLKNANKAVSAVIVYTMKLLNNYTGETIVRVSTAGVPIGSAQKYGAKSLTFKVDSIRPLKVYNKIINIKTLNNSSANDINKSISDFDAYKKSASTTDREVYINSYNICANTQDAETLSPGVTYYGQSQLTIYISKFDNVFKFKMFDLNNYEFFKRKLGSRVERMSMEFIMDNGSIKSFPVKATDDMSSNGEFTVTVDKVSAAVILKQTHDTNFYIIEKSEDDTMETVVYTGMWKDIAERSKELYTSEQSLIEWINSKLKEILAREAELDAREVALNKYEADLAAYADKIQSIVDSLKGNAEQLGGDLQKTIDSIGNMPVRPNGSKKDDTSNDNNAADNSSNDDNSKPAADYKNDSNNTNTSLAPTSSNKC